MRLAVRVRSGVRWHDHRAFGVLDVQATLEPLLRKGNDAPVLRAELADVASIELVTERTVRFVLKRPSDLVLRALCDVPILPDHLIRGVRVESAPIARAADRHRAVPVRRLGARQAHPPRARARILGPGAGRRRDRVRPRHRRRARAQPHAARRDGRPAARARRALPGPGRADDAARRRRRSTACASRRYSFLVVESRPPSAGRRALPARAGDAVGSRAVRARAARRAGAPDRRAAARRGRRRRRRSIAPRAIALLEDGGLPRQRRRRRARSAGASRSA